MIPLADKKILEKARPKLTGSISLDGSSLLDELRSREGITENNQQIIESGSGNRKQVGILLDLLLKGGEDTLDKFIYSLKASEHTELAECLRQPNKPDNWDDDPDAGGQTDSAQASGGPSATADSKSTTQVSAHASKSTAATASSTTQEKVWRVRLHITKKRGSGGSAETDKPLLDEILENNAIVDIADWCKDNGARIDGFGKGCADIDISFNTEEQMQEFLRSNLHHEIPALLKTRIGTDCEVKLSMPKSCPEREVGRSDLWKADLCISRCDNSGSSRQHQDSLFDVILMASAGGMSPYMAVKDGFTGIGVSVDRVVRHQASLHLELSSTHKENNLWEVYTNTQMEDMLRDVFTRYNLLNERWDFEMTMDYTTGKRPGSSGPMTDEHKQIITDNFERLVTSLTSDGILNHLVSNNIINLDERQGLLVNEHTEIRRAGTLLTLITKREDRAFYVLSDACAKYNMPHLANLLQG